MSEMPDTAEETPAPRARRPRGENRRRLLSEGLREFALHGYRGASTTSIARAADVPQPHVYANFATKEQLFLACIAHAIEVREGAAGAPQAGAVESGAVDPSASRYVGRLLLQAVSELQDETLRPELLRLLDRVRDLEGAEGFNQLLLEAAAELTAGE